MSNDKNLQANKAEQPSLPQALSTQEMLRLKGGDGNTGQPPPPPPLIGQEDLVIN